MDTVTVILITFVGMMVLSLWYQIIRNLNAFRRESCIRTELLARIAEKAGIDVEVIKAIYKKKY